MYAAQGGPGAGLELEKVFWVGTAYPARMRKSEVTKKKAKVDKSLLLLFFRKEESFFLKLWNPEARSQRRREADHRYGEYG